MGVLHIVSGGASLPAVVVVLVVHFELDNQTVPFERCEGELGKLVAVAAAHGDEDDFDVILVPLDGPGAVLGVDELLNLKREADEPLIAVCTYFELGVRILVPWVKLILKIEIPENLQNYLERHLTHLLLHIGILLLLCH